MAGLDDESRYQISRDGELDSNEMIVELAAALNNLNQSRAATAAMEAEVQDCLDELEQCDEFVVSDKQEIDSVAMLIEKRQWKGTIKIVDFEDSIHHLHQYALQKGVPINDVAPKPRN